MTNNKNLRIDLKIYDPTVDRDSRKGVQENYKKANLDKMEPTLKDIIKKYFG